MLAVVSRTQKTLRTALPYILHTVFPPRRHRSCLDIYARWYAWSGKRWDTAKSRTSQIRSETCVWVHMGGGTSKDPNAYRTPILRLLLPRELVKCQSISFRFIFVRAQRKRGLSCILTAIRGWAASAKRFYAELPANHVIIGRAFSPPSKSGQAQNFTSDDATS